MKNTVVLSWIGQQLQQNGNGDLPEWNGVRLLWYVRAIDKHFAEFNIAVQAAMDRTIRPQYTKIRGPK